MGRKRRNATSLRILPSISGCLSHERKIYTSLGLQGLPYNNNNNNNKTGNQTDQSKSPYPMTSAMLIGRFHFSVLRSWTSNLKSTVTSMTVQSISGCLHSISGCLSMNVKRENETDQSKSPTSSGTAILIGQFGFPFYVHGTSNLKSDMAGS